MHLRPRPLLRRSASVIPASLVATALTLGAAVAQGPPGGGAPPPPPPEIVSFSASSEGWAWLKKTPQGLELVRSEPGGAGKTLARGTGWAEVATEGEQVWILTEDGRLLEAAAASDKPPRVLLAGLKKAGGIRAVTGAVYWLELAPGAGGDLYFVPAAGPRLQLRARAADGSVRLVGEWPSSAEKWTRPGAGDIIAVAQDAAYVRVRRFATTEFVRFPLAGGDPERLAVEPGAEEGVLHAGRLFWTAPSPEASPASGIRAVKTLGPDGQAVLHTDWLPMGALLSGDSGLWYAALQLYRIPERPGVSEPVRSVDAVRPILSGASLISLDPHRGPHTVTEVR